MRPLRPLLLVLGLLLAAAGCRPNAPEHPVVTLANDRLSLPLQQVADGRVHFFTYKCDGRNLNFFVRTDGSGRLQAHFDACYSCFKYKQGYVQEGRQVVCIACRIGYDLKDEVWDYVGACAPIPLKSRVAQGRLVILRKWLEKGKRFF